jgi:ABC-2 type transport system ATP-binding protein
MAARRTGTAIEVRGLQKTYGSFEAVKGIDLDIPAGEVFALLGPNGAGKTTTVEILEGYRHRSAGDVSVLGMDPSRGGAAFRSRIGIVLQECAIEPYLRVDEVLAQRSKYYPQPRAVQEVLRLVNLESKARSRVKVLSGGQQRRLDLALALVGDPDLIFLDEPTTGFDPSARRAAWEVVRNLSTLGKTILLTTHYMDEAQALATQVAVLVGGRVVAQGTPASLGGRDRAQTIVRFKVPAFLHSQLPTLSAPVMATSPDGDLVLSTACPTADLRVLTDWAMTSGVELDDLDVRRPSLEDVYLQLTSNGTVA